MPKAIDSSGFENFIRHSYQLINNTRKAVELYRNAFSVLNELAEKNYKMYSVSIVSGNPKKITKSLKALIYNDKIKSFFDHYDRLLCVQSKSKTTDDLVLTRGISSLKPCGKVRNFCNTTSNKFWGNGNISKTLKRKKGRCHSEAANIDYKQAN